LGHGRVGHLLTLLLLLQSRDLLLHRLHLLLLRGDHCAQLLLGRGLGCRHARRRLGDLHRRRAGPVDEQ
jgi:hypothetical protein